MMLTVVVLAAGQGSRMCSRLPKVMHPLGGRPLLHYSLQAAKALNPKRCCVVASPALEQGEFMDHSWVIQEKPHGTGDAVRAALETIPEQDGDILVLCGDAPLVQSSSLQTIMDYYRKLPSPALVIVGMHPKGTHSYGRILINEQGQVERIIEDKEASPEEQQTSLCNSGALLGPVHVLRQLIHQLQPNNQAQEYYLTDCVALAHKQDIPIYVIEGDAEEFCGINTQAELAAAAGIIQNRWRRYWLDQGVILIDPASVFFCHDTKLEANVTIEPYVTFGPGVHIRANSHILSFCHIEDSEIGEDATVGPFAHLRGGNKLAQRTNVGNFVEVKHTTMAAGSKAKHLSYLGDMVIGENSNIGAGTINCNYDGFNKATTIIGDRVFVGSHTTLIAPVHIEDDVIIAAGSVIDRHVPAEALAIAREPQLNKPKWSKNFREKQLRMKK
ncbi:MAG: bifunctional UDP-N-acetylglucosamine diphosphorylase/glucosamine-1-phosphate N-acetyltransferase GlmU [Alphaproteobacteria bacterium]